MSGGITQLVAVGAQDVHLTGDPEVSYFKSSYSRHSNFSQVIGQQTIMGNVNKYGTSTVRFHRNGDLLSYVYFTIDCATQTVGHIDWTVLIDKVELLIGGQVIDEQDSIFTEKIAIDTLAQNSSKSSNGAHPGGVGGVTSFFYPLRFFFCENWQCTLPLVALQYHDVEIRIKWGECAEAYNWSCWANYIYLDTPERMTMVKNEHDLLIYQVQKNKPSGGLVQELSFNHPVKFISSSNTTPGSSLTALCNKIKLQFNGVDMADYKFAKPHFVDVPAYYHTNFVTSPDTFLFSFALNTASYQPSGSLNFSRLDSARIVSESQNILDPIYAVNYNILKIKSGMGGLMYAN